MEGAVLEPRFVKSSEIKLTDGRIVIVIKKRPLPRRSSSAKAAKK